MHNHYAPPTGQARSPFDAPTEEPTAAAADSDFDRALRYREMAEQHRLAAEAAISHAVREWLLKLAAEYDAFAGMYELKIQNHSN